MNETVSPAPQPARDRWGRPLIAPPDGSKPVAYTRATTLAGTLDDLYGLMGWKQRMTAVGLAARNDLLLAVKAVDDPDRHKKQLDGIVEQATEAAAASAGATMGTAMHSLTEQYDLTGEIPSGLPETAQRSLYAYATAVDHIKFTHVEQFLVCDDLRAAGTTDRIGLVDGVPTILDLKTGKTLKYSGLKIAIQLAIYAHGQQYDPDTGVRTPVEGINLERACVIHLPIDQPDVCTLHWVDIDAGWKFAHLADQVRNARKARGLIANAGPNRQRMPLEQAIADCRSDAELIELYEARGTEWTEHATALAKGHREFLANQKVA